MDALDSLLALVPTGTAEGERQFIQRVFVEHPNFADLVVPPAHSPLLLVGKKGTGKTALIDALASLLLPADIPLVKVTPGDMALADLATDAAVGEHMRVGYAALIGAVAKHLALRLQPLVRGKDKELLDHGLQTGIIRPDLISRLAVLLPRLAKPIAEIDLTEIDDGPSAPQLPALREAIVRKLSTSVGCLYLVLDDTDQVALPDRADHLNRIWGVLLAARKIAQDSERIRVLITLREEVWRRINREGAGQRDQADHFAPLVRRLGSSRQHLAAIVSKRLGEAARDAGRDDLNPFEVFFDGKTAYMPLSKEQSSWEDIIVSRSRERPRDAVQLIRSLAVKAKQRSAARINQDDLDAAMPDFSMGRVEYLSNESESECPSIKAIVERLAFIPFDQGSFKASFEILRNYCHSIPSTGAHSIFNRALKPQDDDSFLLLLQLLFDLGVLNARISDVREKDGYRHIKPEESPSLVSKSRWTDLQKIVWEVNPAYRDFLLRVQANDAARQGLATSQRNPRR
ncbi:P-loop ATPase, Sll1717 family [Solimonas flava]|uniref:P-loop ATPase, Sll1717 family n=1 Tax=Solimonas flava TaxID=415849 RepID=UPI0012B57278|nr:hypothetical protein [Solimonas flava]